VRRLALLLACLLLAARAWAEEPRIRAVDAIGMTVADMDRSVDFYARLLGFTPVSDVEVAGHAYEQLRGVFPVRMRVVRLQLAHEYLELTEYLAPRGRPAPVDARSNDRWFQHVAIVARDMDRAYEWLHVNLGQVAQELYRRLGGLFVPDADGIRPCHGRDRRFRDDPYWRDLVTFAEYFCGDSGRGIGARYQGWTALAIRCFEGMARSRAE